MNKLVVGAMVAVLCGFPVVSRAEAPAAPERRAAPAQRAEACPQGDGASHRTENEACDYAAREKASPQLEEFAGGADGIYIGGGVLAAALVVVLLLALL
jgi:hypothetical protein